MTEKSFKIRAHHLLCILGFKGLGYDAEFVRNMSDIVGAYLSDETIEMELLDSSDDVCRACPWLKDGKCSNGEDAEASTKARDTAVLGRLGLSVGTRHTNIALRARVASRIASSDLKKICVGCEWVSAGCCEPGLEPR